MDDLVVVCVGASAGGVKALKRFFEYVPADGGIAYVAILHLSPEYESHLHQVLQTDCVLPVAQIQERTPVQPNHVYVISPNQSLSMSDGMLAPSPMLRLEERRAPVDIFLRTLADARSTHAVCVLLSGSGSDGSSGLKRIKERGGLCLVQDPGEAEHPEMPRNAIATGLVDQVLPIADLPRRVVAYARSLGTIKVPEDRVGTAAGEERAFRDIFSLLRARTGHDFINYKRSTVGRRLQRRLAVHELASLSAYAEYLRDTPDEAQALLKDLLISVTSFFRDGEAFDTLEHTIIPRLFESKGEDDHVRVWVAGCATGEEAYSVAMLLADRMSPGPNAPSVQVFATDIDDDAIVTAREALYTAAETADVPPDRLRRYFAPEGTHFRVRKELRELVLFARHNIIKDPPFSHLDLITCRNLLIYLNRGAQQRALDLMHFGLRPGGYLFLGSSESIDGSGNLFVSVEKDANIFQSREVPLRPMVPLPEASVALLKPPPSGHEERSAAGTRERMSYAELHQRLLEEYAAPSIVVDEEHEILHMSDRAARFLQFAGGEPSTNLLRTIRPELRIDLRTALYEALQNRTRVEARNLRVNIEGRDVGVTITVRPVVRQGDTARGFLLVLFEEDANGGATQTEPPALAVGEAARHLEDEIVRLRGQLRATVEQHEIQAEELRASNEELQAMNEELRSTAEELETSKEELQSVNEELTTVNQELKIKIEEQSQANNDIQNLINTTEIAAVFLDRTSRVKLFTPRARDIFNLIPTDRGRPLSDISSSLEYRELHDDVARVLERLERVEREVALRDGRWLLMAIVPYRTWDDRIDGVVLTFVDMTERRKFEERLRRSEERLRSILESIVDHAVITQDEQGRIRDWNVGAERMFGYAASEAVGQSIAIIFTPEDRERNAHVKEMQTAREQGRAADERWHLRRDGSRFYVSGVLSPLGGAASEFVKVARDLTERKRQEETLKHAHSELEQRVVERTRQLRDLLNRVISVQEDERRRIARDLHDDIGQKMTALHLKLDALRRTQKDGSAEQAQTRDAQEFLQQLDRDLDNFTWQLRPAALYDLGLAQALRDLLAQWTQDHGVSAEFYASGFDSQRFRPDIEVNLYRIAQEALNNVHKHARATKVAVVLQRRDHEVVLAVEDNGIGLDPASLSDGGRGMGLVSMRERATLLGGTLEIERSESGGTSVIARAPAILLDEPRES